MITLMLFVTTFSWTPPAAGWRVVVQELCPRPVAASGDRTRFVFVGGSQEQVLQVYDTRVQRIVRELSFPAEVVDAVFSPRGDILFVSTGKGVWRVALPGSAPQLLLPGVSRAVLAVHREAPKLGILGQFEIPGEGPRKASFRSPRRLGVYDWERSQWRARAETPIKIYPTVTFSGDTLYAGGVGGKVTHRRATGFRCHTALAPSGEVESGRGPETFGRRALDEPSSGTDYVLPRPLLEAIQQHRSVLALGKGISSAHPESPERPAGHFAAVATAKGLRFVAQRGIPGAVVTSVVEVDRTGLITAGPALQFHGKAWPLGSSLAGQRGEIVMDLADGSLLFACSPSTARDKNLILSIATSGTLLWHRAGISLYPAGQADPLWTARRPGWSTQSHVSYRLLVSPDGRRLVAADPRRRVALEVIDLETGKKTSEMAWAEEQDRSNVRSMCFSTSSEQLGLLDTDTFRVYDIATGNLVHRHPFGRDKMAYLVAAVPEGWLLSTVEECRLFQPSTGWGPRFDLRGVYRATAIDTDGRAGEDADEGRRYLLENGDGVSALATTDGRILTRWFGSPRQSQSGGPNRPSNVIPLSEGPCFLRAKARGSVVEIVDARDGTVRVTIHPVPVADGIGWIAWTADGAWDASPGAADRVEVFSPSEETPAERSVRHDPGLVQSMIRESF